MKTADEIISTISQARLTKYMADRFNEAAPAYIARIERRGIRQLRDIEGLFIEDGVPFFVPEADFKLRPNGTFQTGRFIHSNFRRAEFEAEDRLLLFGDLSENEGTLWRAWHSDFGVAQAWADIRAMGVSEFEDLPRRELSILAGQEHQARKLIAEEDGQAKAYTTGWKLWVIARAANVARDGHIQF